MKRIKEALYRAGFRFGLIESVNTPERLEAVMAPYVPRHALAEKRAA